jgi:uncharacterized protein (TIGR03435 family)
MIGALTNHLWQSTLFAAAAATVAFALRRNTAQVRHAVWLTASLKFLVPFSLLLSLGAQWGWSRPAVAAPDVTPIDNVTIVVDQIAQPFSDRLPVVAVAPAPAVNWLPIAMSVIWACGCIAIVLWRMRGWRRVQWAVKHGTDLRLPIADSRFSIAGSRVPITVLSCPGLLEPGIVGVWRPVLLLPADIEHQLTPLQLDAVLAHELCHVQRRDNTTAAMHMVVEAVFWFHPLVWWIGSRMVDERERACDEHVLTVVGQPEAYAEGILNVCKLYVESPITCVSGITGLALPKRFFRGGESNLKKRIEAIMINQIGLKLNAARKCGIVSAAVLALIAPVIVGMITAPIRARAQDSSARFDVVSIKPCAAERQLPGVAPPPPAGARRGGAAGWHAQTTPGRVYWDCATLATLVDQAYADSDHPLLHTVGDARPPSQDPLLSSGLPRRVRGGASWTEGEKFTIEAKSSLELTTPALAGSTGRNLVTLPSGMSSALRSVLEDRFKVKVHRVTEQQDMYALRVASAGISKDRVKPTAPADCVTSAEYFAADPADRAGLEICGRYFVAMRPTSSWKFTGAPFKLLADALSEPLHRYVLDETGMTGLFNFLIDFGPPDPSGGDYETRSIRALNQLGLKLQSTTDSAEYLVIDRAERPTPDFAASAASSGKPMPGASGKAFLPLVASTFTQTAQAARFDVASIKPCEPGRVPAGGRGGGAAFSSSPGRVHIECFRLALLVDTAYIKRNHIDAVEGWPFMSGSTYNGRDPGPLKVRGGESWVYNEQWTVEAKAPTATDEDTMMGPMLRALLEDRFQLKLHRESEDVQMWALTVAKGGPKFKPIKDGDCIPGRDFQGVPMSRAIAEGIKPTCGMVNGGPSGANWRWEHGGQELGTIAGMISGDLGVAVLDRTGLTGKFNLVWEYGPDENTPRVLENMQRSAPGAGPPTAPNIFTAIEEQLGLKLERVKSSRGYLVIDKAERPAPDGSAR